MANVNVNRNVTDAFYRYKMPRLIAKVEGKGNGIKTVIANMSEIAKALSRPPTYTTKYFGCELGAQTQFDMKNERYIVNGAHDASKLQDLLDGFIKRFVLCPECDNPETLLIVKKSMIHQRCIACGHVCNVDMRHKLTTFILKNPPEAELAVATNGASTTPTAPTPGKTGKKRRGKDAATDNGNGDPGTADNTAAPPSIGDAEDDIDWGEDTSAAAVLARREAELSGATENIVISDDLEKTVQERVDMFYSFVKQRKVAGELCGVEKEKEVVLEAERLEIRDKAPVVLAELLYDVNVLVQIKQYRTLFCRLTQNNEKEQRYLLGAFEQLVGAVHPNELLSKVPHVLKAFYDNDILDESLIIEWHEKPSRKYTSKAVSREISKEVHDKAAPFIQWLKEAEEESSDDDDDDDDEEDEDAEVIYNVKGKVGNKTATTNASAAGDVNDDDDGDDVDIDAI